MSNDYYFLEAEAQAALLDWHRWLDDHRGDRARLRRAESPEDILLTEAFFHFLQKMPQTWRTGEPPLWVAAGVAGAVAQVKSHKLVPSRIYNFKDTEAPKRMASFAEQLATPPDGKSKAPMSELRFQQLQKSRSPEDFYRAVLRAIRLLDGSVNILSLANDIIHWHQEYARQLDRHPAKRLAVRWATDYFTALPKTAD